MGIIKSTFKKIKTISHNGSKGIEAIKQGVENHQNYKLCVEVLAEERAKICFECPNNIGEPNNLLKISDDLIPEVDGMMCNDCGCALPYKIRQSIIKCSKWNK